jgi:hypothetical protein
MIVEQTLGGQGEISTKQDTIPDALKGGMDLANLDRLRKMFDQSRAYSNASRLKAQRDRDYYDGPAQLDSEVRLVLQQRGQPAIYTNRIRPAVNGILGTLISAKADPRAFPRTPDDDNKADVATKTLRYIADASHLDQVKIDCAEDYLISGTTAIIIESQGQDIPLTQIRYEEFFGDPYSRRADWKDAQYLGIAKWMYAADVKLIYPEQYAAMGDPVQGIMGAIESTFDDRPDNMLPWVDRVRQRLMVVEIYYREDGEWMRAVFCAAGAFEKSVSPYRDDRGHSICPIEAVSCYVDRDNNRYGVVRDMIPIQDEINSRRSRSLHLSNSRQIQQVDPASTPVDPTTARQEASKADGVIPPGWQLVATNQQLQGNNDLLQEAKSEIERIGPTPAVLGRSGPQDQSGRARLVEQQAGLTELARPLGRLEDWELRIYKQSWFRAKQFWTAPMFIRVSDDPKAPEFIQLNQPKMGMVMAPQPAIDETGQPLLHPQTGAQLVRMVPTVGQVGADNAISEMDMDIILDTQPDTANLQQEVWSDLLQLSERVPLGSPEFMIALELSPMPDKAELIDRIKALTQKQQDPAQAAKQQQQEQVEQAAVGLQLQEQQGKVEGQAATTQKNLAEAARTRAEVAVMLAQGTEQAAGSAENGLSF